MVRIPESPIEKVDIEQTSALRRYLRARGRIGTRENVEIRILAGGVSNRTVLVRRESGETWVLKQALERLRVAVEWLSPPERILREAQGMRRLSELLPPGAVPDLIFEDAENFVLAMSAVPQPHRNWKSMLLAGQIEAGHIEQFAHLAAAIHSGRSPALEGEFGDTSYFESLRLEPYYLYAGTRVPSAAAFLSELAAGTRAIRQSLVHGDFSPKNILVHQDRLILLDHEVIHFGDPAFDLGFSLTHLLSKANHLPAERDRFAAAAQQYWQAYTRAGGIADETRSVRHTLACLLARVDGRSPLEYLTVEQRTRQRAAALGLMARPPRTVADMIELYTRSLN